MREDAEYKRTQRPKLCSGCTAPDYHLGKTAISSEVTSEILLMAPEKEFELKKIEYSLFFLIGLY